MTIPPESFDDQPDFDSVPPDEIVENYSPVPAESESQTEVSPLQEAVSDVPSAEDMTLAELIGQFFRAPGATWDAFRQIVQASDRPAALGMSPVALPRPLPDVPMASVIAHQEEQEAIALAPQEQLLPQGEAIRLGLRFTALLVAIYGNGILAASRAETYGLDAGAPILLIAFLIWMTAEAYGYWPSLTKWFGNRQGLSRPEATQEGLSRLPDQPNRFNDPASMSLVGVWGMRLVLAAGGLTFSLLTVLTTKDNKFTVEGVICWGLSILLWVSALAPSGWGFGTTLRSIRRVRIRVNWTFWTLLVIMLIAAYFRLYDLNGTPPEMTSDHVEKLLDSQRILDGNPQVFFPNNGGREPIQFYLMALISHFPGLGMNFFTLKFLTAVEGLVTIPVLWWMGREMIGEDDPELGNVVGLVLAALVAVSYWDVMLSRLGLRIVLTTLFTGLLVIYFSRALRYNRRGDFIRSGVILGAGMYAYQAVRMLPVVVIAGVILVLIFAWFRRRKNPQIPSYTVNSAVLVLMALVVFVPLLVFWVQYPNDFWRRTSGRLLGDDLIQTTDASGRLVERVATLDERMAAFRQNLPILLDNIHNALLMYNWKGDVAWITAAPNYPEMDVFTGALLIIGLGAWLVRMIRRRDPADWLMPPMLFIMLLPSALSLAYPVENPSATRTSGTLPVAYLFAALPLALIVLSLKRLMPGRPGSVTSFALVGLVVMMASSANWNTYFGAYHDTYLISSPAPYTEAGKMLKGFTESGGDYGNAFMIAYPYWWDHRAVGIEAGLLDWPNGIVALPDTPRFLYEASQRTDRYKLDPEKDLLFFYSRQDTATDAQLKQWFPTGYSQLITSYKPGDDFMVYHVPRLGTQGFIDFAVQTGAAAQ